LVCCLLCVAERQQTARRREGKGATTFEGCGDGRTCYHDEPGEGRECRGW